MLSFPSLYGRVQDNADDLIAHEEHAEHYQDSSNPNVCIPAGARPKQFGFPSPLLQCF